MTLIVGLGNPSSTYENTRHNIGFKVVDLMVSHLKATAISKSSFKGELFRSDDIFLLKPLTYMNLSGVSVQAVMSFYKDINRLIVIHDDLDLPLGSMRFKLGGSSGGHNGLKSIDQICGAKYLRVRFGIGRPPAGFNSADFVLSKFSKLEIEKLPDLIKHASKSALMLVENPQEIVSAKMTLKAKLDS